MGKTLTEQVTTELICQKINEIFNKIGNEMALSEWEGHSEKGNCIDNVRYFKQIFPVQAFSGFDTSDFYGGTFVTFSLREKA